MRSMLQLHRDVAVLGMGSALPPHRMTNPELQERISNYDESSGDFSTWVDRVTHIQERPVADPETDGVATLGIEAARKAVEDAGIEASEVDYLILASFTFLDMYPGVHAWMATELGITGGSTVVTAGCAGAIHGINLARALVQSGQCRNVLVVAAECITRVVDYTDPITAVLFSDAAGAVVVGVKTDGEETGFLGRSVLHTEFANDTIQMWNANSPNPGALGETDVRTVQRSYLRMAGGPRVLRNAVNKMAQSVCEVLGFTLKDLKRDDPDLREILARVKLIPHQANGRIVDGLQEKLRLPREQVYRTIYWLGNCSAATNLVTLDYAAREGNLYREPPPDGSNEMGRILPCGEPLAKGDLVVITAIGAGYLYGAIAFTHSK